jgi:hypothetical protein
MRGHTQHKRGEGTAQKHTHSREKREKHKEEKHRQERPHTTEGNSTWERSTERRRTRSTEMRKHKREENTHGRGDGTAQERRAPQRKREESTYIRRGGTHSTEMKAFEQTQPERRGHSTGEGTSPLLCDVSSLRCALLCWAMSALWCAVTPSPLPQHREEGTAHPDRKGTAARRGEGTREDGTDEDTQSTGHTAESALKKDEEGKS